MNAHTPFSRGARRVVAAASACVALLAWSAQAQTPRTQTEPVQVAGVRIVINCARPALPKQQAFAQLAGIDNFSQAYAARAKAMVQTQHECQRGYSAVELVQVAPRRPEFVALALR
jgi:hypothetical protein